jgi:hypothetical protein
LNCDGVGGGIHSNVYASSAVASSRGEDYGGRRGCFIQSVSATDSMSLSFKCVKCQSKRRSYKVHAFIPDTCRRGKLYIFGETLLDKGTGNKTWRERGLGDIKLLK